jgi:serine protease
MGALAVTLGLAGPALAASASLPASGMTGNLLVLLDRHGASAASAVGGTVAQLGARRAGKSVPQIGLITVRPGADVSLAALARRLRALPGVASVQSERRYVPRLVPNDPALAATDTFSGTVQWALAREGFYSAWDLSKGDGATVGVIDTGIDANHPDLKSKLAVAPIDQQQEVDSTGPPNTDQVGHGTHVASLACADTDNGIGLAGAGYDCKLVIEKTDFSDSSIAASIIDATDRGAEAINMSFGPSTPSSTPAPASEVRALQYAAAHNVILVAAAADSPGTEQGDPANVLQPAGTGPDLSAGLGLDVTAADYSGNRASFAGSGSEISLAAYGAFEPDANGTPFGIGPPPGVFGAFPSRSTDLESLPDPCLCRTTFQRSSSYAYLQGTSMAAPQVAAVGAMMRQLNPYAPAATIVRILKQTAQRPAASGFSSDLGWGILDAGAALSAVKALDAQAPVSRLSAPRSSRRRAIVVRWRGMDPRHAGLTTTGIAYYDIYVRDGKHRQRLLLGNTTKHKLRFRGRPGHVYTFESIAVDHAGNREAKPTGVTTQFKPARPRRRP